MVRNDKWMISKCLAKDEATGEVVAHPDPMIAPFMPMQVSHIREQIFSSTGAETVGYHKVISYGLSSYGYDARLASKFKLFTPIVTGDVPFIDPKSKDHRYLQDVEGDYVIMPPHSYLLGHTIEYFKIPNNIMVIALGKSTYARAGLIVNVTPLEPGWEGQVTIEISNATPLPAKVYANEGICQFVFFEGEAPIQTYADRNGKYMRQTGITPARA